jgi:nitroreductase
MELPSVLDLLGRRRSVAPAQMLPPGPDTEQLTRLLSVACRVPDHGKLAPWRFLVFAGPARARAGAVIANVFANDNPGCPQDRLAQESNRLTRAPVVVAVISRAAPHAKIPEQEQWLSAGALCMNLLIASEAMGFAACWLTEWFAYDRRVLADLGLTQTEKMAGFIHIGRALTRPADRIRPVLEEITQYF